MADTTLIEVTQRIPNPFPGGVNPYHEFRMVQRVRWDELPYFTGRLLLPHDWDPNWHFRHDGRWPEVVTLQHETVECEGLRVPLFEGDVERREWEARRRAR